LDAHPHDAYDDDFSPAAVELFWLAVAAAWRSVRNPGDALATAFADAERSPVTLRPPVDAYGARFRQIIGVAFHLQSYVGDATIWLPVTPLAVHFGLASHAHVAPLLALARQHGLLISVSAPSFAQRLARGYRFNTRSNLYLPPGDGA